MQPRWGQATEVTSGIVRYAVQSSAAAQSAVALPRNHPPCPPTADRSTHGNQASPVHQRVRVLATREACGEAPSTSNLSHCWQISPRGALWGSRQTAEMGWCRGRGMPSWSAPIGRRVPPKLSDCESPSRCAQSSTESDRETQATKGRPRVSRLNGAQLGDEGYANAAKFHS